MALNKNKLGGALLSILAVLVLLVLMDLCIGGVSSWLYHHSKYGIFHRQVYVLNESRDDIIILGSSRASHHYIPNVFSDSLGVSCYNAGSDGMCIFYHYAMLASMIERGHCPKCIIYEVMDLDAKKYPGPTFTLDAALDRLAPHYGEFAIIDSLFQLKGKKEALKMLSRTYRYNSKLVQSIVCNFIPSKEDAGYEELDGRLPIDEIQRIKDYEKCTLDSTKILYIRKLIELAKENEIHFYFVLSPKYAIEPSSALDEIKKIAMDYNVPWMDFMNENSFMNPTLFSDKTHLNGDGAYLWSKFLANKLIVLENEHRNGVVLK